MEVAVALYRTAVTRCGNRGYSIPCNTIGTGLYYEGFAVSLK